MYVAVGIGLSVRVGVGREQDAEFQRSLLGVSNCYNLLAFRTVEKRLRRAGFLAFAPEVL
jgi:hypothetical protein